MSHPLVYRLFFCFFVVLHSVVRSVNVGSGYGTGESFFQ